MSEFITPSFAALLTKYERQLSPAVLSFARDILAQLQDQALNLAGIFDHGLSLSDNQDAQLISRVSDATPDTEETIAHTLRRVPTGIIVVKRDQAGIIYTGPTAWTDTEIFLKCNVASMAADFFVF